LKAAAVGAYDDDYTAELPLSSASIGAHAPLLSRLDDIHVDDVPSRASESASNHDKNDGSLSHLSYTENGRKNRNKSSNSVSAVAQSQLPAVASQKNARDITAFQPASSSSWQSVTAERQQLNHAVVAEKRRLAAQRERLRKLRLVTKHFAVLVESPINCLSVHVSVCVWTVTFRQNDL